MIQQTLREGDRPSVFAKVPTAFEPKDRAGEQAQGLMSR